MRTNDNCITNIIISSRSLLFIFCANSLYNFIVSNKYIAINAKGNNKLNLFFYLNIVPAILVLLVNIYIYFFNLI